MRYEGKSKWICIYSCKPDKEISIQGTLLRSGVKTHCGCKRKFRKRSEIIFPNEYKDKSKVCIDCNIEKSYEEFYFQEKIDKDGNTTYYFYTMCIKCNIKRAYKRNQEHIEEHMEVVRKNNKKPHIILSKRAFAKKQRESGYYAEYQKDNPEKFKIYNENRQHKNHTITKSEWEACKKYFNYTCAYCGLSLSEHYYTRKGITKLGDFHKEHVDHEGKNDLSNCVCSCGSCNDKKWKFYFEDWYNEKNTVFSQERHDKILLWLSNDYKQHIKEPKVKGKYTKN